MKKVILKAALFSGLLALSLTCMADAVKPTMSDADYFVHVSTHPKNKSLIKFETCLATPRMLIGTCNDDMGPGADDSPYCETVVEGDREYFNKDQLKSLGVRLGRMAVKRNAIVSLIIPIPLVGSFADADEQLKYMDASKVLSASFLDGKEVLVRSDINNYSYEQIKKLEKSGNVFMSMDDFVQALRFGLAQYNAENPK